MRREKWRRKLTREDQDSMSRSIARTGETTQEPGMLYSDA